MRIEAIGRFGSLLAVFEVDNNTPWHKLPSIAKQTFPKLLGEEYCDKVNTYDNKKQVVFPNTVNRTNMIPYSYKTVKEVL